MMVGDASPIQCWPSRQTRLSNVAMKLKRGDGHIHGCEKEDRGNELLYCFVDIGLVRGVLYDNYWIYLLLN